MNLKVKKAKEFFRGCLIGGAIGDALGYPVEFLKREEIIERYGKEGITDLIMRKKGKAEISDDTQMTLFTAEGIILIEKSKILPLSLEAKKIMYQSYLRWLYTQGFSIENSEIINAGFLVKHKDLHDVRIPGFTCISALSSGKLGTIERPINNSKGCGGVIRVAPCGLVYSKDIAFEIAMNSAALTHGHPSGYLSAGAFAYLISLIIEGYEIERGLINTIYKLKNYKGSEETLKTLIKAYKLFNKDTDDFDAITKIGRGFTGEEALAISVYCALKYKDNFKKALIVAVNHDGDSDSTGAITGNILGAYLGIEKIPEEWINKVELRDVIIDMADRLFEVSRI